MGNKTFFDILSILTVDKKELCLSPGRHSLERRPDVYKLEESAPLDTLPFISVNTVNLSRDMDSKSIPLIFQG